jgi:hypothetical protein
MHNIQTYLHTITDWIRALPDNDSVNSPRYTGGQQYSGDVFCVVRAATIDFCSCKCLSRGVYRAVAWQWSCIVGTRLSPSQYIDLPAYVHARIFTCRHYMHKYVHCICTHEHTYTYTVFVLHTVYVPERVFAAFAQTKRFCHLGCIWWTISGRAHSDGASKLLTAHVQTTRLVLNWTNGTALPS